MCNICIGKTKPLMKMVLESVYHSLLWWKLATGRLEEYWRCFGKISCKKMFCGKSVFHSIFLVDLKTSGNLFNWSIFAIFGKRAKYLMKISLNLVLDEFLFEFFYIWTLHIVLRKRDNKPTDISIITSKYKLINIYFEN